MHIARLPAAWATMTADELEEALTEAVVKATAADNRNDNVMLVVVDGYFAECPEPADEAERRRDLLVLLSGLLEHPFVSC